MKEIISATYKQNLTTEPNTTFTAVKSIEGTLTKGNKYKVIALNYHAEFILVCDDMTIASVSYTNFFDWIEGSNEFNFNLECIEVGLGLRDLNTWEICCSYENLINSVLNK